MGSSRDVSGAPARVCAVCSRPLPEHSGGGRSAQYCGRACQMKAHRARVQEELSELRQRCADLEAQLTKSEDDLDAAREIAAQALAALEELRALRREDPAGQPAAPDSAVRAAPEREDTATALPPQIDLLARARSEQAGDNLFRVYVGEILIGTVHVWRDGQFEPLLPNGVSVYLGSTARSLEDAEGKLVSAYRQYAGYWHNEARARLTLLKPRMDGSRTVKWGAHVIGRVKADGGGWVAYRVKTGVLCDAQDRGPARHMADAVAAAEALLADWRERNPPVWGALVTDAVA